MKKPEVAEKVSTTARFLPEGRFSNEGWLFVLPQKKFVCGAKQMTKGMSFLRLSPKCLSPRDISRHNSSLAKEKQKLSSQNQICIENITLVQ